MRKLLVTLALATAGVGLFLLRRKWRRQTNVLGVKLDNTLVDFPDQVSLYTMLAPLFKSEPESKAGEFFSRAAGEQLMDAEAIAHSLYMALRMNDKPNEREAAALVRDYQLLDCYSQWLKRLFGNTHISEEVQERLLHLVREPV